MKLSLLNSETAVEELNDVLEQEPHLVNYTAIMCVFDQKTKRLLKVTSTNIDTCLNYLDWSRNETTRDQNYWNNYDSARKEMRRGFTSHIPHDADPVYMIDLCETSEEADATKKAFLPLEAKLVRMPPFSPIMEKVFGGEEFNPTELAGEANKYQEYRKLALGGN